MHPQTRDFGNNSVRVQFQAQHSQAAASAATAVIAPLQTHLWLQAVPALRGSYFPDLASLWSPLAPATRTMVTSLQVEAPCTSGGVTQGQGSQVSADSSPARAPRAGAECLPSGRFDSTPDITASARYRQRCGQCHFPAGRACCL